MATETNSRLKHFRSFDSRDWYNQKSSTCTKTNFYLLLCMQYYTVEKHWRCLACRRKKNNIFYLRCLCTFLELLGNKRSLTRKCWDILVLLSCTLSSVSEGFAGSFMFLDWVMSEFQSVCCMASWSLANATKVVKNFKDVFKHNLNSLNIRTGEWELLANDRAK